MFNNEYYGAAEPRNNYKISEKTILSIKKQA